MHADSSDILARVESAYHQHFEMQPDRASISFVGVEPIEVLRYRESNDASCVTHYLTLGMSRHPMVPASASYVDESAGPRSELLLTALGRPDELWRRLAVLAAAPSVESAVYQRGGRIDLGEPWFPGSRCTGAVLGDGPLLPVTLADASAVSVLQVLPAHPVELAWARVQGSEALMARWAESFVDLRDLARGPVVLD